ncbi:MAG: argininosuccinate lyase [Desulfobacterota bacterium]|nr:argininosuccinate lyase [Thermodesulfobacteriota bacterium]MDW8001243.1 argininosuccinate lyase [Deltaproteobacteria bacterium]
MKPWGGRFLEPTDPQIEDFTASIEIDKRLFAYDIMGSIAYAEMLERIGILSEAERKKIVKALEEIKEEIETGRFKFSNELEDIHMHVERRLVEKIGETGNKLHTGRSRNEQISLDVRMFLKDELREIECELVRLMGSILEKAEKYKDLSMPGYTHMRKAQIVPFGHYMLSFYYMFKRDRERIKLAISQADAMPLGTGALAGSTIPIDREYLRERLGFSRLTENSMDTASDRDFVLDATYALSVLMVHLSRLSEDLIIFSTEEFSFFRLPDRLLTGSSLMPHKKNPDALELIRGRTARVISDLFSLLVLLKALPSTYNRDLQEDKEPLFHALSVAKSSISIMRLCIEGLEINREGIENALKTGYIEATELAEYLVLKGLPFREAHRLVGTIIKECDRRKISLKDLQINELKSFSSLFDEDVYEFMDPLMIVKKRMTYGGASYDGVVKQIEEERVYLSS